MTVALGCFTPHPPALAPLVGGAAPKELSATRQAMEALTERIAGLSPDVLVIMSPHTPSLAEAIGVNVCPEVRGNLAKLGRPEPEYRYRTDLEMARAILEEGSALGADLLEVEVGEGPSGQGLDYGVIIPLRYLLADRSIPIVSIGVMLSQHRPHYLLGQAVSASARKLGKKTVFIASGNLSHKLSPEAPFGYSPEGPLFDQFVREALDRGDFRGLLHMDPDFAELAAECGLRTLLALGGCFDGRGVRGEVLSYEAPFGVGYLVAAIEPIEPDAERSFFEEMAEFNLEITGHV